jgi:glycosyltransferase involved in cell wall biosynthesis
MDEIQISLVIPLLNEEESLPKLVEWIERVMQQNHFSYEIWLIDDGSTDSSWQIISSLHQKNPCVKGLRFLRNYGKSAALSQGFKCAQGQVVITMDADLQDSPDEIPALYRLIEVEGFDLVSGWKKKRYDPISKTIPTKLFNWATRKVSGLELHDFNCGLKAYRSEVVKNIEVYGEMHRYLPVIAKWTGYKKIGEKIVEHRAREFGKTKFGLERFINGFLDLISITFVFKFRKKPMHFFGTLGTICFGLGFAITLVLIGEKMYDVLVLGRETKREIVAKPLFYIGLTTVVVGVQLFMAGFLAELLFLGNPEKHEYKVRQKLS